MEVYLVIHGIQYESEDVIAICSDYVKARQIELKYMEDYSAEYGPNQFGYTEIRKVELDKAYENGFGPIGEKV